MNASDSGTSSITTPSQTYMPLQGTCHVCGGSGLVYGLDGKPYLCPKCGGEGSFPMYPQYYIGDPISVCKNVCWDANSITALGVN